MRSNQRINITSRNYPNGYPADSNCRYQLRAPASHVINLTCNFLVLPNVCDTKILYISRDGDAEFREAESFCHGGIVSRTSNFQSMSIGYQSTGSQRQRARLSCEAVAVRVPCKCGWSQPTRITNGAEASRNEFPSMVGIRDIDSNLPIICGGSIISERFIVTAAHCTERHPTANRLRARVGVHDLRPGSDSMFSSEYAIRRIIQHPNYNSIRIINDIALLQTVIPIVWSRGVGPICLPFGLTDDATVYAEVDIAGWGSLSFAQANSNTLQKTKMMTIPNSICNSAYNNSIVQSHICTNDYRGLGKDSCQHDSGGPVIMSLRDRKILVGVISFGRICGQQYGTSVNTRISSHLNWISRYVGNSVCTQ